MTAHHHLAFAQNLLRLILMPTERCNFRCVYCYEDFAQGRMAPAVVAGVKSFLSRRAPELDRLLVDWFGGEPLLAADVVEEVQEHVGQLGGRYPGLNPCGSMTTNGYRLTAERLRRLVERGVRRYQISLDGLGEDHDRKRVRADGQGTFDVIWGNLVAARETDLDFEVKVRVHVDEDNLAGFEPFLDHYRQTFGHDGRFRLFVRDVARLGGPNDDRLPVFQPARRDAEVARLRELVDGAGVVQEGEDEDESCCYAAMANSFVIRSNGDVAKCTVALNHANNRVGRLLPDGSLQLDSPKVFGWMRGLWSGDREELHCPMIGFADRPETQPAPLTLLPPV